MSCKKTRRENDAYSEAIKRSLKIIEVERNAEKAIYDVKKCLGKVLRERR